MRTDFYDNRDPLHFRHKIIGVMDSSTKRFVIGVFIVQAIVSYLLLHYGS
jgi:hypothetical protein